MVKFQNPVLFCIIFAISIFFQKKGDTKSVIEASKVLEALEDYLDSAYD